ncbi:MAG: hypothetical protein GF353_20425 [Candidatus Lokiarchaeota archaeon]|nr:hypothetical protein [Candidatus Lokiarchaeota archaeon]
MGYLPYSLEVKAISWLIVIILLAILASYFYYKMFNVSREFRFQRLFFGALATFLFCYMMARIFFLFSDFERDMYNRTLLYNQFVGIGHLFNSIGVFFMILLAERNFLKFKKPYLSYFLLSSILIGVFALFFPAYIGFVRIIFLVNTYISWTIYILIYINVYRKVTGLFKKTTMFSFLGIFICLIGAFIETDFLLSSGLIPPYLTPILFSIGIIIISICQRKAGDLLVEFFTGKKICLVHKGKIMGKIAICPNCLVSYCERCFTSVIMKENACWFCKYQFTDAVSLLEVSEERKKTKKISKDKYIDNNRLLNIFSGDNIREKIQKYSNISITFVSDDFFDKLVFFDWVESDLNQFVAEMLFLSSNDRMSILDEMIKVTQCNNNNKNKLRS